MNRTALGAGVVAVLALVLVFVLLSGNDDTPTTTSTTTGVVAPTTSARPPTTTTAPPTTTQTTTTQTTTTDAATTTTDLSVREAEVEALVTELDLAYWTAIYDQDIEALADIIGGQRLYENSLGLFESGNPFTSSPTEDGLAIDLVGVLLDREDCVVADVDEETAFRDAEDGLTQFIFVLWPIDESTLDWRIGSIWAAGTPESVWIDDCSVLDRDWRP
jgi:hypothetical protein